MRIKLILISIISIFSLTSCKMDVSEAKIDIFISQPIGSLPDEPIPDNLKELAIEPFICGDSSMYTHIISVFPIYNLDSSVKITDKLNNSFAGDPTNPKWVKRKLKEHLDSLKIGDILSKRIEIDRETLKLAYNKIFKEAAPNSIFVLTHETFPIDSFTVRKDVVTVQTVNELRKAINKKLCESGPVPLKILIEPYLPEIELPKEKEAPVLLEENEVAFEMDDKTMLRTIGEEIISRLEIDPLQWQLWYALSINRIKLGYLDQGMDNLKSAVKEAIDMGEGDELLRYLEKKENFIQDKYKGSDKPRHLDAILTALKRNEKCLIEVITQTVIAENWHNIGRNTVNLIPDVAGFYKNSYWGFRIHVKEKYKDHSILVDIFVPNKNGTIEKLDFILRLGQEFTAKLSDSKIGEGEWEFIFINESPSDCSHVKIRYDIRKI